MTRKRKWQPPAKTEVFRIIDGIYSGAEPITCSTCPKEINPGDKCTFICDDKKKLYGLSCGEGCYHKHRVNIHFEKRGMFG